MKKEKSCGCILVRGGRVLLVYEKYGRFWGFPKGHVEPGETEPETALREVREEVGLEVEADTSFRYELRYVIRGEIEKTVVLFPAAVRSGAVTPQESEIGSVRWCSFAEALETLTFEDWKNVLRQYMNDHPEEV